MMTTNASNRHAAIWRGALATWVLPGATLLGLAFSGCAPKQGPPPTPPKMESTQAPAETAQQPNNVDTGDPATSQKYDVAPEKVEITDPPDPPKPNGNPLLGAKLFVDEEGAAYASYKSAKAQNPEQAKILEKIALQPQAFWVGDWSQDIFRTAQHFVNRAVKVGTVPVFVAYNIPYRDCGQWSKGGSTAKGDYQEWIRRIALGIGQRRAVVVLEPDALGHIQECLTKEQIEERFFLIKDAVKVLRQNPNTVVYIDAGHARWVKAEEMAKRLKKAGIEYANGFALNVSNYVTTEENTEYGKKLSELTGGAHFVIDTSRNGAGPAAKDEWCNPPGRKIGRPPTTETGDPLVDAHLWLKRPGESDGACNGGPEAGKFWLEGALNLAR